MQQKHKIETQLKASRNQNQISKPEIKNQPSKEIPEIVYFIQIPRLR